MLVICQDCGKPFEAKRSSAEFCSSPCRVRAHRHRQAVDQTIARLKAEVESFLKVVDGSRTVPGWERKATREALLDIRRRLNFRMAEYEKIRN